jgi:hypothetical protein
MKITLGAGGLRRVLPLAIAFLGVTGLLIGSLSIALGRNIDENGPVLFGVASNAAGVLLLAVGSFLQAMVPKGVALRIAWVVASLAILGLALTYLRLLWT